MFSSPFLQDKSTGGPSSFRPPHLSRRSRSSRAQTYKVREKAEPDDSDRQGVGRRIREGGQRGACREVPRKPQRTAKGELESCFSTGANVRANERESTDLVPSQFAIRPTLRNHNILKRDSIIQKVASLVGSGHKVDLKNYDDLIIVEAYTVSSKFTFPCPHNPIPIHSHLYA